jgi:aminoglycoside phosphotransferase (APT) family kinase protein
MTPFALGATSAPDYLRARGIEVSNGECRELGGGVSNTVVLVESAAAGRFVVKQALPRLRVREEWLAERSRIFRERDGLVEAARLLPAGAVPAVLWSDEANFLYAMEAAPAGSRSWKEHLLDGDLRRDYAEQAGRALGLTVARSWADPALAERFGDQRAFEQLRTDPYYREIARRHPAIAPAAESWIAKIEPLRLALTHGDWSPKNMLVAGERLLFIDYECLHFGDPAYDLAFCLNHLALKAFHRPDRAEGFAGLARTFRASAAAEWEQLDGAAIEERAARHLAFLLLARVDGKSPAEYLTEEAVRGLVRRTALELISANGVGLDETLARLFAASSGR